MQDVLKHPLLLKRKSEVSKNLENIVQRGFEPSKFCLMPFVNIILEPDGSVGLCRHKGTDHALGNLKNNTWQEIWNGQRAQNWRSEFLTGKPLECHRELKDQKCNLCPELGKMLLKEVTLESDQSPPLRLTANFNGKCNLQCQMCDVWQLPNGNYTEENFWSQARVELFPFLKEVDMLSGEPFIQKDTYKLIEELSAINPQCLWSITTNAHWRLNKKMTDALDSIVIKNLILSVDSLIPETYAKIRKLGKLDIVLQAIDDLLSYEEVRVKSGKSALNMNLNFLVQKDNWKEVTHVIDFCLEKNIHPFITFCYRPSEFSLLELNENERVHILNSLLSEMSWDKLTLCSRIITPLIDSLPTVDKSKFLLELKDKKSHYEKS